MEYFIFKNKKTLYNNNNNFTVRHLYTNIYFLCKECKTHHFHFKKKKRYSVNSIKLVLSITYYVVFCNIWISPL